MAKPIILVHGAWHASWCWKKVIPLLGETTISVDLPGHGPEKTNFRNISLKTYVDFMIELIQSLNEPVVLVGHSLGGITISQVAEYIPDKVDQLIYISALLPPDGTSINDEMEKATVPEVAKELVIDLKTNSISLTSSSRLIDAFYQQSPPEDAAWALSCLQPEPFRPFGDSLQLSNDRFGKVKKTYFICENDQIIPVVDQERNYQQHGCRAIHLNADHSPFFSAPVLLANHLLSLYNK